MQILSQKSFLRVPVLVEKFKIYLLLYRLRQVAGVGAKKIPHRFLGEGLRGDMGG
jgi:hypothetical protein